MTTLNTIHKRPLFTFPRCFHSRRMVKLANRNSVPWSNWRFLGGDSHGNRKRGISEGSETSSSEESSSSVGKSFSLLDTCYEAHRLFESFLFPESDTGRQMKKLFAFPLTDRSSLPEAYRTLYIYISLCISFPLFPFVFPIIYRCVPRQNDIRVHSTAAFFLSL